MGLHRRLVWKVAKGFRGRAGNCIKLARQQAEKALQHAYRGRKEKKREHRSLWVQRINAGSREHGVKYSEFQAGLRSLNVQLNRKVLSELAAAEPFSFQALVDQVKFMRGGGGGGGGAAGGGGAGKA
ncbi:MAG: mitochondrial ribosomal protein L20 [Monoraphidium minutum]|nr:MAG: mitochondrial ribosomal protein L20 [Monoraphidium minutum]